MKSLSRIIALIVLFFIAWTESSQAQQVPAEKSQAQSGSEDFYLATWNVKAFGLPQGDAEMLVKIERKDGKLTGGLVDAATKVERPFTKVEPTATGLTAYFDYDGTDVFMKLVKKDEANITGSIMDMFNLTGTKSQK
jgi:hypothetical protein